MNSGASLLVTVVLLDLVKEVPLNNNGSLHTFAHDLTGNHLAAHR